MLNFSGYSFEEPSVSSGGPYEVWLKGKIYLFNTEEEYKNANLQEIYGSRSLTRQHEERESRADRKHADVRRPKIQRRRAIRLHLLRSSDVRGPQDLCLLPSVHPHTSRVVSMVIQSFQSARLPRARHHPHDQRTAGRSRLSDERTGGHRRKRRDV